MMFVMVSILGVLISPVSWCFCSSFLSVMLTVSISVLCGSVWIIALLVSMWLNYFCFISSYP